MARQSGEGQNTTGRDKSPEQEKKVNFSFQMPESLLEEARDIVVALSGPPERLTLADFATRAIRNEIQRLRALHNKGQSFEQRGSAVRSGRPIGQRKT